MSSYATVTEFEEYVEGWVTDNEPALERLLERATRDVDNLLGPLHPRRAAPFLGLKLNPAEDLDDMGRAALSRAVCAQAMYRHRNPELLTGERMPASVEGPDFKQSYSVTADQARGRYAPELRAELAPLSYLRVTGVRAHA